MFLLVYFLWFWTGQFGGSTSALSFASTLHRASGTVGLATNTQGRAQVHNALSVSGGLLFGRVLFCDAPQLFGYLSFAGITVNAVKSGKHPFHIAIRMLAYWFIARAESPLLWNGRFR